MEIERQMRQEQARLKAQQEEERARVQAKQQERDQTLYNLDTPTTATQPPTPKESITR
jgi:hypothetical protein